MGDYYTFRDTDRTISGARTGHCFRVGERVEVILDRIDRQLRRLQFALHPSEQARRGPRLVPGTKPVASARKAPREEKPAKTKKELAPLLAKYL